MSVTLLIVMSGEDAMAWGRRQAALAPPWSDAKRQRMMRLVAAIGPVRPPGTGLPDAGSRWWLCPNRPPCTHAAVVHDVDDLEDPIPRCRVSGCPCGAKLGPVVPPRGSVPPGPGRFTCPACGLTSPQAQDVRVGYCGACHNWTGGPA